MLGDGGTAHTSQPDGSPDENGSLKRTRGTAGRSASPIDGEPGPAKVPRTGSNDDLKLPVNDHHFQPCIGPRYQAVVGVYQQTTPTQQRARLAGAETSAQVWCSSDFQPADIQAFLLRCTAESHRRFGLPLSPQVSVKAFEFLGARKRKQPRTDPSVVPLDEDIFTKEPWGETDRALFVTALSDCGKDFNRIRKEYLQHKTVMELVKHYYGVHKQVCIQQGGTREYAVRDRGSEPTSPNGISPDVLVDLLRSFARMPQDGFPPEQRMATAVQRFREARYSPIN